METILWAVLGAIAARATTTLINEYLGPDVIRIHGDSISKISQLLSAPLSQREREYFEATVQTAQDKLSIYRANPAVEEKLLDEIVSAMLEASSQFERIGFQAIGGWVNAVNLGISAYVIHSDIDGRYLASAKTLAQIKIPEGEKLIEHALQHSRSRVSNECTCEEKYDGVHGWRWHCRYSVDGKEHRNATSKESHAAKQCRDARHAARDQIIKDANERILDPVAQVLQKWREFSQA